MNNSKMQIEMNQVIEKIKKFWNNNISNIEIKYISDKPVAMFSFTMKVYDKYDVMVEYERSTLGYYIGIEGNFIGLSKLAAEPVLRGFDSYRTEEDILHNFKILDDTLKSMDNGVQ